MTPKRIGLIGFDGVVAVDLSGPADAFACANEAVNDPKGSYEVLVIASSGRPFVFPFRADIQTSANFQKRSISGHSRHSGRKCAAETGN
jgi:hypothetical protein